MNNKIIRYEPETSQGLNTEQITRRKEEGLVNYDTTVPTKSIKSIIATNFFTLFNIMNFLLAIAIFAVGEYKNMLFIGIIIVNTAISTIQEIHSKRVIDKLSLLSSTKAHCIRNGKQEDIGINEIVLDDILCFKAGNQVVVDCILQTGEVEVNESFITGEADPILKRKGDTILSGSYIISGNCKAKVEHIGEENFTSKISKETKYIKKVKSEIMTSLNKIIRTVSIIIVPVGTLLFLNQLDLAGGNIRPAVVHTVAAIIGMIPEGLVLLTSTVLAVSVVRLSKTKVLVQELFCIETLAHVDTLCLDKTGTITEGKMEVSDCIAINIEQDKMKEILSAIGEASQDSNATIEAIREAFQKKTNWKTKETVAFSSEKKWSGVSFEDKGSYILGAPEYVLGEQKNRYQQQIEQYSNDYRVILLAHSNQEFQNKELPKDIEVLGLVLITDKIRENAKKTLEYFKSQGVAIRIISGDNPITVSKIAKRAGVEEYENYVDCTTLKTKADVENAIRKYKIFGRVSPIQKKQIIEALKKDGHTVAMTGDGVNDIIALKEADCSIAMASGSDAARNVSQLVLLDSDFASMPKILAEGRRTINNLERSAALFLSKTIYSTLLAILFVFINAQYPFMPIQLSLIGLVCIGIPSFILALEPNKELVKGTFIGNVISKSIPAGLTVVTNILILIFVSSIYSIPPQTYATIAVILTVLAGFCLLIKISRPFNLLRGTLLVLMVVLWLGCSTFLNSLFSMTITEDYATLVLLLGLICVITFITFNYASEAILNGIRNKKRGIKNGI